MQVINTGPHSKDALLVLVTGLYKRPTHPKTQLVFSDGLQTLSTLGVKYSKKKKRQVYWVSCIRILDYGGSKLEAQMTLGQFYLVHHSNFTYIITEIKQALHNRVLLPQLFSFQDYGNNEHKLTDLHRPKTLEMQSPITVCNVFTHFRHRLSHSGKKNSIYQLGFKVLQNGTKLLFVCSLLQPTPLRSPTKPSTIQNRKCWMR